MNCIGILWILSILPGIISKNRVPPVVTVSRTHYVTKAGDTVTLHCKVTSTPFAKSIWWEKETDYGWVDVDTDHRRIAGATPAFPSLIIHDVELSDEGKYKCFASNNVGTGESNEVDLEVLENDAGKLKVAISEPYYNVRAGNTITLYCSVAGSPKGLIIWWVKEVNGKYTNVDMSRPRFVGSTPLDPSLTIRDVIQEDEGYYKCNARNIFGEDDSEDVALEVNNEQSSGDIPLVIIPATTCTSYFGETLTIKCIISAKPVPTEVYWEKMNTRNEFIPIDMTNTAKYSGSSVANPSLTIRNLDADDMGDYICYAVNSVGEGGSDVLFLKVEKDKVSTPAPTLPNPTTTNPTDPKSLSSAISDKGVIIGGVGGIGLICITVIVVVCIKRRTRNKRSNRNKEESYEVPIPRQTDRKGETHNNGHLPTESHLYMDLDRICRPGNLNHGGLPPTYEESVSPRYDRAQPSQENVANLRTPLPNGTQFDTSHYTPLYNATPPQSTNYNGTRSNSGAYLPSVSYNGTNVQYRIGQSNASTCSVSVVNEAYDGYLDPAKLTPNNRANIGRKLPDIPKSTK